MSEISMNDIALRDLVLEALESGLDRPNQSKFIGVDGELDLRELADFVASHLISSIKTLTISGKKLVIALPMYRTVPVNWFFNWLRLDQSNVGAVVGTEAMYLPMAMEILINKAFQDCPDFDRLVVLEHDMIIPTDAFTRIAQYGYDHDIVGSVYSKHEYPFHYMAWMQVKKPMFSPITAERMQEMIDAPGLYEVDGVAMGLTSIARHVLEDWNYDVPMWTPAPPLQGHDLHFCNEAKKPQHGPKKDRAYKVWLDSGIGCGHLTQVEIGHEDSQRALAEVNPPTWAAASKGSIGAITYDEGLDPEIVPL